MQQLAGLFPGSYYNNDESKALDFMGYFAHQRQQDEAFKNQELNRQAALEDLFQSQQMNPLKVNNQRLANDTLEAQLGGHRATSRSLELKTAREEELQPHIIKQKIAEAFAGLSEAEGKNEVAQINRWLLNPHLTEGQRKVFEMLRDNIPENYKLNKTLDSKETIASIPKPGRTGTGGPTAPKQFAPPRKLEDLEADFLRRAAATDDEEEKARLTELANNIQQRRAEMEILRAQARKAGGVDVGAVSGLPTVPAPTLGGAPPSAAPKPAAAPKAPAGRVVIYKDGKAVGTIPESQRDAAVKQGYLVK